MTVAAFSANTRHVLPVSWTAQTLWKIAAHGGGCDESPGRVVVGARLVSLLHSDVASSGAIAVAPTLSLRVARATSDVIARILVVARTCVVVGALTLHAVRHRICKDRTHSRRLTQLHTYNVYADFYEQTTVKATRHLHAKQSE